MKLKQGVITNIPLTLLEFYEENKHPYILDDLCDEDAELLKSIGVIVRETGRFVLHKWCYINCSLDEHLFLNKDINDSFEFEVREPKWASTGIKTLCLKEAK